MGDWDILTSLNVHLTGLHVTNVSVQMPHDGLPKITIEGVVMTSTASETMTDLRANLRREDEARRLDQAADEALKTLKDPPEGDWRRNEWRADGDLFL